MRYILIISAFISCSLPFATTYVYAQDSAPEIEKSLSETLDLWRDGRFDQLFERLSHRGKMSKEKFQKKMKEAPVKPACCWQKLENFKLLGEKRTEATVYAKIGLEHGTGNIKSVTREFKLSHDSETWKMQLSDITGLAGISSNKSRKH